MQCLSAGVPWPLGSHRVGKTDVSLWLPQGHAQCVEVCLLLLFEATGRSEGRKDDQCHEARRSKEKALCSHVVLPGHPSAETAETAAACFLLLSLPLEWQSLGCHGEPRWAISSLSQSSSRSQIV